MSKGGVLVAGGAGFIGSHTCKALALAGYQPVTLDDLSTGYEAAVRWGPFYRGDIADADLVGEIVERHGVISALHFAASSLVGESVGQPAKYFRNNVSKAVEFVEGLSRAGVKSLVFSSTAAVYGDPITPLISEEHPTVPVNPYGASKLAFEAALKWLGLAHGLNWTVLRYFNAAGADPDGEIGESHAPETHLIPLICQAALSSRPMTVFGTDYATPDGSAVRDYVHVTDLAEAHVLAVDRLIAGGGNLILNVGAGRGASVLEVLAATSEVLGRRAPYVLGPRRPGDPPVLVANGEKLQSTLGWTATRSDLHTMISTAMAWQTARPF